MRNSAAFHGMDEVPEGAKRLHGRARGFAQPTSTYAKVVGRLGGSGRSCSEHPRRVRNSNVVECRKGEESGVRP